MFLFFCMQTQAQEARSRVLPPFVLVTGEGDPLPRFTDEELWQWGMAVTFIVNKTNIRPSDPGYRAILDAITHIPEGYTFCRLLVLRGSASPEGPQWNNRRLAHGRAWALVDSLRRYVTLPDSAVEERYVTEDYQGLRRLIADTDNPYRDEVMACIDEIRDPVRLKKTLQRMDGGRAWKVLLHDFYPRLRATRVVMIVSRTPAAPALRPMEGRIRPADTVFAAPVPTPPIFPGLPVTVTPPRRELLAVKTNLLLDGAWVPQYGWCPIPNIEVEYMPLRGHWTLAASFDMPWWQSSAYDDKTERSTGRNHKFFQVRNYQLMPRWYLHRGDGPDGFHGLYVYPYAGVTVYGIGFTDKKGWMGEAVGAGGGIGWKLPLGRVDVAPGMKRGAASHWHLELALQLGVMRTKYDPYQYGCPHGIINDGRYYYRYYGAPALFRKRQHHRTYLGPTRVGVTIGYDLLYRSRRSTLTHWKGGRR